MANVGIVPLDPSTDIGRLRLLVGDTASVELAPPVVGHGDYAVFSDAALVAALAASGDNQLRAAGMLFLRLAAEHSMSGRSIKTDDLAIDTRNRGKDLLAVAQSYFDEATAADNATASDFFQIVPFGGRRGRNQCCVRPEGTPHPLNCG